MEPLEWLVDAAPFVVRSACGAWTVWMANLNIFANATIAVAYFGISAHLAVFYRRCRDRVRMAWIVLAFSAFVGACGTTHACDVAAFWAAPYRLFTVLDVVTALLSSVTLAALPSVLRYFLALPSPAEMEAINAKIRLALQVATLESLAKEELARKAESSNRFLREKLQIIEGRLRSENGYANRIANIADIRQLLDRVTSAPEINGHDGGP